MLAYARKYEWLIKANSPWSPINGCIYRLNRLKTTVIRPYFMEVLQLKFEGSLSEFDMIQVFQIIETYIFRRSICDIPTNALNKIFLLLHKDIMRLDGSASHYPAKLKWVLLNKIGNGRFPDDKEFSDMLSTRNIYSMKRESKFYLFERIENADTLETKDVWAHLDARRYTIEHIMPQKLTANWKNDLGNDYERIHSSWLHRLANLTLTAYNAEYFNHPFIVKRDTENGYGESGIRLNQWIARLDEWGEAELENRNNVLIERAVKVWPFIETNYEPAQKQYRAATLDDEIDFTGQIITKYAFMGIEQSATSWADMYTQVLIQLYAMVNLNSM